MAFPHLVHVLLFWGFKLQKWCLLEFLKFPGEYCSGWNNRTSSLKITMWSGEWNLPLRTDSYIFYLWCGKQKCGKWKQVAVLVLRVKSIYLEEKKSKHSFKHPWNINVLHWIIVRLSSFCWLIYSFPFKCAVPPFYFIQHLYFSENSNSKRPWVHDYCLTNQLLAPFSFYPHFACPAGERLTLSDLKSIPLPSNGWADLISAICCASCGLILSHQQMKSTIFWASPSGS